jgi:hypothetical protein
MTAANHRLPASLRRVNRRQRESTADRRRAESHAAPSSPFSRDQDPASNQDSELFRLPATSIPRRPAFHGDQHSTAAMLSSANILPPTAKRKPVPRRFPDEDNEPAALFPQPRARKRGAPSKDVGEHPAVGRPAILVCHDDDVNGNENAYVDAGTAPVSTKTRDEHAARDEEISVPALSKKQRMLSDWVPHANDLGATSPAQSSPVATKSSTLSASGVSEEAAVRQSTSAPSSRGNSVAQGSKAASLITLSTQPCRSSAGPQFRARPPSIGPLLSAQQNMPLRQSFARHGMTYPLPDLPPAPPTPPRGVERPAQHQRLRQLHIEQQQSHLQPQPQPGHQQPQDVQQVHRPLYGPPSNHQSSHERGADLRRDQGQRKRIYNIKRPALPPAVAADDQNMPYIPFRASDKESSGQESRIVPLDGHVAYVSRQTYTGQPRQIPQKHQELPRPQQHAQLQYQRPNFQQPQFRQHSMKQADDLSRCQSFPRTQKHAHSLDYRHNLASAQAPGYTLSLTHGRGQPKENPQNEPQSMLQFVPRRRRYPTLTPRAAGTGSSLPAAVSAEDAAAKNHRLFTPSPGYLTRKQNKIQNATKLVSNMCSDGQSKFILQPSQYQPQSNSQQQSLPPQIQNYVPLQNRASQPHQHHFQLQAQQKQHFLDNALVDAGRSNDLALTPLQPNRQSPNMRWHETDLKCRILRPQQPQLIQNLLKIQQQQTNVQCSMQPQPQQVQTQYQDHDSPQQPASHCQQQMFTPLGTHASRHDVIPQWYGSKHIEHTPARSLDYSRMYTLESRFQTVMKFETEKLAEMRKQRAEVKMNLRGRAKLEFWLWSAAPNTMRAVSFLAIMFSLDPRLTSPKDGERTSGMQVMSNADLRLCEALMSRVSSRDGAENCKFVSQLSFSKQGFLTVAHGRVSYLRMQRCLYLFCVSRAR